MKKFFISILFSFCLLNISILSMHFTDEDKNILLSIPVEIRNSDTEFFRKLASLGNFGLYKIHNEMQKSLIKNLPNFQFRIKNIQNQLDRPINIKINGSFNVDRTNFTLQPGETLTVNLMPRIYEKDKTANFIITDTDSRGKELHVRVGPDISGNLYGLLDKTDAFTNNIFATTAQLYPHIDTYDINIILKGENFDESKIKIALPLSDLFDAVKEHDYDKIKEIIKRGINILVQDDEGNTILHYAAQADWADPMTEKVFGFLLSVNPQLLTIANNEGKVPLALVPSEIRNKVKDLIAGKYSE